MMMEQIGSHERDCVCGLSDELVSQLFVVGDEMCDIHVAVVLLDQNILLYLISAVSSACTLHFRCALQLTGR